MRKKTISDRIAWFATELWNTWVADESTSTINQVKKFQQWTPYSCTAAVLQMVLHYVSGHALSHRDAIKIMQCKPDGALLVDIIKNIRKLGCHIESVKTRTTAKLKEKLEAGYVAIACDDESHVHNHAILVVGCNADGFWLIDPITTITSFRPTDYFLATTCEWTAVRRKNSGR